MTTNDEDLAVEHEPVEGGRTITRRDIALLVMFSPLLLLLALLFAPGLIYHERQVRRGVAVTGTPTSYVVVVFASMACWTMVIAPIVFFANSLWDQV